MNPTMGNNNILWIYHWFLVRNLKLIIDPDGVRILDSTYKLCDFGNSHPSSPAYFMFKYGMFK
jgi:hypothetical protein